MMATPDAAAAIRKNPFANREFGLRVVSGIVLATLVVAALV
ncbi:MAG: phosphatidate cytidylyltransferase, partial [Methylobacterium sp.]